MKVKIKSFKGELPSYLTEGKEYEIEHIDSRSRYFVYVGECDEYFRINDMGDCSHLNGGSWEVVDE